MGAVTCPKLEWSQRDPGSKRWVKHGHSGHPRQRNRNPAYNSWATAKQRCFNPKNSEYPDYGGRGITMCQRWATSYETFYADMGPRPPGTSLDRHPNPNGNYELGNCRWATQLEQNVNKRTTKFVEVDGKRIAVDTLAAQAELVGIPKNCFRMRITNGWTVEQALTTPVGTRRTTRFFEIGGERLSLNDLACRARRAGIPKNCFRMRIANGWPIDQALTAPVGTKRERE